MPFPILLLAAAAAKFISGKVQSARGQSDAARNTRPELGISTEYQNLLDMYEQMAQYGLDRNALDFATQNNQSAFANSLDTLLKSGGSPNEVSDMFGQYANSFNNLAIEDSDRKWQKVNAITSATDRLFNAKRDEFLYNEDGPYKDKAQLAAERQRNGYQMQMSALDTGLSALSYGVNKNYNIPKIAGSVTSDNSSASVTPGGTSSNEITGVNIEDQTQGGQSPIDRTTGTGGGLTSSQSNQLIEILKALSYK